MSGDAAAERLEVRSNALIMMVDDEPTTLEVIATLLQGEGYERFVAVEDARLALATAVERRPDVVLLDLMMPHVDGLEILAAMRADARLKHTPVVILTSSTDAATRLEALERGATDFLAKPVDPSELALRLRNALTVKAYQDRLIYYDGLTGLPNRRFLMERLVELVGRVGSELGDGALLHLRLARFQQIEDALGRRASDELVKKVAERLQGALRPTPLPGSATRSRMQILSRAARDEFLVLVEGSCGVDQSVRIARSLLTRLEEPCRIAGHDLVVSAHVGITLIPDDGRDAETLLGNASIALSHARERNTEGFRFHDESLNAESRERLRLETHLREAVARHELQLHYQPKVEVTTGRILGAEALSRWWSPEIGWVPPDRFIPIAEESDLIMRIGEWCLRTACRQLRRWLDAGFPALSMAINVSSRQFRTGNLTTLVATALEENRLDGKLLVLELTESMITENPDETARILAGLQRLGVSIAVDDFGTGHSSLSRLKRFPIDEIKVDRSFVKGVPDDPDDCAIVAAVVAMGRALGLRLVAEGVETEAQRDFLHERGCEILQGDLCGRAVPAEEWPALLRRQRG